MGRGGGEDGRGIGGAGDETGDGGFRGVVVLGGFGWFGEGDGMKRGSQCEGGSGGEGQ